MMWPILISGFTLGAVGSLHCIGMCGPLSLALPFQHLSKTSRFLSLLAYQFGRIITYSFFGLLLGLVGRRLFIAGYQQWFSLCLGSIIILFSLVYFFQKHSSAYSIFNRITIINRLIGYLLRRATGPTGFLLFGMANGLLPCGMVYIALLTTLSFTEVSQSVSFMATFGLGTVPAMMTAAFAIQKLKWKNRMAIRRLIPYLVAATGVLLLLRGMNLGISFISPQFPSPATPVISCH